MSDELRCQNCGNASRFNVVVSSDAVNGKWCRVACSRMCAHILAEHGRRELYATSNYKAEPRAEVTPILSGRAAQTVHLG